jgi:hypothetical protein
MTMQRHRNHSSLLGSGHGSQAEAPIEKDKPPAGLLGVLLVLLVVILFVVGFLSAEILRMVNDHRAAQVNERSGNAAVTEQRALDASRLTDYARQESGAYVVPIDRAKQLLLQRGSAAPVR